MRGRTQYALPIIIALAAPGSIVAGAGTANAAETCLTSPKLPGPVGSRWYYRLDHANQRKCWHLVSQGHSAARETAAAQPRSPKKQVAAPATVAADESAEAQDTAQLITRNVSEVAPDDALVIPPVEPPAAPAADTTEQQTIVTKTPAVPAQAAIRAPADVSNLAAPAEQAAPQPSTASTARAEPVAMAQYIFLALMAIVLGGGAVLYVNELRRRRNDVLRTIQRPAPAPRNARAREPMPAVADPHGFRRRDDVEAAVNRPAPLRQRRAA